MMLKFVQCDSSTTPPPTTLSTTTNILQYLLLIFGTWVISFTFARFLLIYFHSYLTNHHWVQVTGAHRVKYHFHFFFFLLSSYDLKMQITQIYMVHSFLCVVHFLRDISSCIHYILLKVPLRVLIDLGESLVLKF